MRRNRNEHIKMKMLFFFSITTLVVISSSMSVLPPFLTEEEWRTASNNLLTPSENGYYNHSAFRLGDDVFQKREKSFIVNNIWPGGRVAYTLNPNLSPENRIEVAKAFADYHDRTCIRFVPKQPGDASFVDIQRDDNECGLANVCRFENGQFAKFGSGCQDAATMIHELGHTLCMSHEFLRSDRDDFIHFVGCDGGIKNDPSWWTTPSFFDYFSIMHYGGCSPGACMQSRRKVQHGYCGSVGRLSVLDVDKINARYNCGGCLSHRWIAFDKLTPSDILVETGSQHHICRMMVDDEVIVGKAHLPQKACWVPYYESEVGSSGAGSFEVLTNPSKMNLVWKPSNKGKPIPLGAISGGRGSAIGQYLVLPETYYIGKCAYDFGGGPLVVPGKVNGDNGRMYISWGGRSYECENYEVLTCEG